MGSQQKEGGMFVISGFGLCWRPRADQCVTVVFGAVEMFSILKPLVVRDQPPSGNSSIPIPLGPARTTTLPGFISPVRRADESLRSASGSGDKPGAGPVLLNQVPTGGT